MKSQILRYILSFFNEGTVQAMAAQLGEKNTGVTNALERIIPTILRGFASKSQEGASAANSLLSLAKEANSSSWWQKALDWINDDDKMKKGQEMLHQMFGNNNVERIAGNVATQSGIKSSSAEKLMQWAAPLCLGALGKEATEKNLDASSLASWIAKEPLDIDGDGLIAGAAAATRTTTGNSYTASSSGSHSTQHREEKKRTPIWIPLLLLLLLGGLIWWLMKGKKADDAMAGTTSTNDTTIVSGTEPSTSGMNVTMPQFTITADSLVNYQYGEIITEKLPDGTELRIPNNSAEASLISKIREAMSKGLDTTEEGKKSGWINLYDVQFSKMTTYREGAQQQVSNIAAILKAFPGVKIKIGGYTDNTGSGDINTKLSQDRADKVKKELAAAGVGAQVEKAEGYGPQFPIADNSTPEGRAQNRRVSCRIVSVQ